MGWRQFSLLREPSLLCTFYPRSWNTCSFHKFRLTMDGSKTKRNIELSYRRVLRLSKHHNDKLLQLHIFFWLKFCVSVSSQGHCKIFSSNKSDSTSSHYSLLIGRQFNPPSTIYLHSVCLGKSASHVTQCFTVWPSVSSTFALINSIH